MLRSLLPLALLLAACVSAAPSAASACGGAAPCTLGGRSYRAQPPEDWDGRSPLSVLLHFHGWGRTGAQVLSNDRIARAASANGMLLIAPDGLGKSWNFWTGDLRDVEFADAVIADAARRWPIDRARVMVSGFSYGGAMAWRVACARGPEFAAYLPIAGTLWRQDGIDCTGGPARMVQVHGRRDNVMDLPVGPGGDEDFAVSLWRRVNGAEGAPVRQREGRYDCSDWAAPPPGRAVTLCLHDGNHMIPPDWLGLMLPRLLDEIGPS